MNYDAQSIRQLQMRLANLPHQDRPLLSFGGNKSYTPRQILQQIKEGTERGRELALKVAEYLNEDGNYHCPRKP